ncbi:MAG: LEPR-XLL domain-containing protein [Planctomycetales bacterium]|nr:LEPR-XLL domain-containing protein [Planctomycetales bacterium]
MVVELLEQRILLSGDQFVAWMVAQRIVDNGKIDNVTGAAHLR